MIELFQGYAHHWVQTVVKEGGIPQVLLVPCACEQCVAVALKQGGQRSS